jgi:virginiamycin A acetyltransferase
MLKIDPSSYIMSPHQILSYDSRKQNGELPIIKVGKKCSIAVNCNFILGNHLTNRFSTSPSPMHLFPHNQGNKSSYSKGDIVIKNDVWIGANTSILDGITIHNGAVLAAGSIVTKDVPPYAIVGGNPARVIKYRFSKKIIDRIEALDFWNLPIEVIDKFNIWDENVENTIQQIETYLNLVI